MAKKKKQIDRKGPAFESDVVQILSLMQYQVSHDINLSGTQIDILAQQTGFLQKNRLIVECADHGKKVGVPLVKEKSATLGVVPKDEFIYKLLYVSRMGFTKEALEFASNSPHIDLLSFNELESNLINFESYARWFIENYEHSAGMFAEGNLATNFIELNGECVDLNLANARLSQIARKWLADDTNNLMILLGEFGSGKTSFCRNLAYQLLDEKYRKHLDQPIVPILVNLRENMRMFDLPKVLFDTLVNRFGVRLPSFLALEHFCSKRRILLILDGLDEMIDKSDKKAIADCFNQVFLLSTLKAKVIVSCRTNFFKANSEMINALKRHSISIEHPVTKSTELLSFQTQGSVVYVSKLSPEKIEEYISNQVDNAEEVIGKIRGIHDLSDLCTRPVLLNMILDTLPRLEEEEDVNSALLYKEYTDRWTARDEWRVSLPLEVRQRFCVTLAWAMHSSEIEEMSGAQLHDVIRLAAEGLPNESENLEKYKNDIQTCSFLVRPAGDETFRFAHKSFLEFFAAAHFVEQLTLKQEIKKTTIDELMEKNSTPSLYDVERGEVRRGSVASNWGLMGRQSLAMGSHWESLHLYFSGLLDKHRDVASKFSGVFSYRNPGLESAKVGLTEEIATFALEILSNSRPNLPSLLADLTPKSLEIVCDILRMSKAGLFATKNVEYLRKNAIGHDNAAARLTFCTILASSTNEVDLELVQAARTVLDEDAWSYFLFELAANEDEYYCELFDEIALLDELRTIDKVIVVHGRKGTISRSDHESSLFDESVIIKLLESQEASEVKAGVELADASYESPKIAQGLARCYRNSSYEIKVDIIQALGRFDGNDYWQVMRSLLTVESNRSLVSRITSAEERMRGRKDKKKSRKKSRVKDSLWQKARKPLPNQRR